MKEKFDQMKEKFDETKEKFVKLKETLKRKRAWIIAIIVVIVIIVIAAPIAVAKSKGETPFLAEEELFEGGGVPRAPFDPDTQTPRLPEYYGQGYDMFNGNPLDKGGDKGFTSRQIFQFTYSTNTKSHDGQFFIPHEVSVTPSINCNFQSSSHEVIGMKSYSDVLKTKVEVSGDYSNDIWSAGFSSSVSYQETEEKINKQSNIQVLTLASCRLYEASLKFNSNLTDDFKSSIEGARRSGDWESFIKDWGTHYGSRIALGASAVQRTQIAKSTYQKLSSYGVDVSVALNAEYMGKKLGISTDVSLNKTQTQLFEETETDSVEYYIGQGPPSRNIDAKAWLSSVQNNGYPAPLSFTLKPISSLFDPLYLQDSYSDTELTKMKSDFEAKVTEIASKRPKVPSSDNLIPPVKRIEAHTQVIGSSEGDVFTDFPVADIAAKTSGVRYYSSDYINSLCLKFNHGGYSPCHGDSGGEKKELIFPSGTEVVRITVYKTDDAIIGLAFTYKNGGEDFIGKKSNDYVALRIHGNLVGLRGRKKTHLNAIGFMTNFLKYDPNDPVPVPVYSNFVGGNGGYFFETIYEHYIEGIPPTVTTLFVYYTAGQFINGIELEFSDGQRRTVGSLTGSMAGLTLDNVSVIGFWGHDRLNAIQVWRRNLPSGTPNGILYGNAIGVHQKVEFHEWDKFRLVGMVGRADTYINRLSLIMARA